MSVSEQSGTGRVLIVDDDRVFRLALGKVLTKAGYTAVLAEDGDDAERRLAEQPFDVMIVDLKMPKKDGLAVLRDAMRADPTPKVIMITAFGDTAIQAEAARLGVFAYTNKPIRRDDVLTLVRRALGGDAPNHYRSHSPVEKE